MNEHFNKNDETLVELTLLGDGTAYEELVTRHQRAVMGTAYKVTKNKFSAEDASQDAFVSAWMNLCELRDGSKFGSWVCSFAKNCARTLERHYRAAIPDISLDTLDGFEPAEEDELFAEDELKDVRQAVNLLSEKIREAVSLHYFEGKSVAEIAEMLSVPVGTVKWRLSEGRKQLRKGYGIMEKTYDENESLVSRVMRQVEALKLWQLKNDKTGFEEEYRAVLANVEALEDSKEKSSMLADTLLRGYWEVSSEKNKEVFERIKKSAEDSHNEDVMMSVACEEYNKYSGEERIRFMRETQIPYYREGGYPKTLAYVWFWLGYEYREKGECEEAIRCYEQVMNILTPSDVYYANAKSAIEGERRSIAAEKNPEVIRYNFNVTGEVYRKIDGKLYFWGQPGYDYNGNSANGSLFWNMSRCDGLILDESMKTGDTVTSSDGITLTYLKNGGACDTPAGHFENCSVYVIDGVLYGRFNCETWLCDGIGIVRQIVTRHDNPYEWVLSSYKTGGKGGLLPFEAGNHWEYALAERETAEIAEKENIFEVTACDAGSATLSYINFVAVTSYYDTWEGKTAEARYGYCKNITPDDEILCDASGAMKRAEELAVTKRQKLHTAIANKVMRRIFETDPAENPDYTEKGRWNFFEYDAIKKADGKISCDDLRKYSFEWKDMSDCGRSCVGYKVLYSFFFSILQDAAGCLWSDEWKDGYHFDERKSGKYVTKNFNVKGGETVITPAGTFENCLRVSFDFQSWGYFSVRSEYLFADGVGIVRFEHPYGNEGKCAVWQLTEYKGTGKGFFPTDDGLFRRYEADALSDGWHGSVEYTFDEDETGTVMFKDALGNQDRADYEKMKKK